MEHIFIAHLSLLHNKLCGTSLVAHLFCVAQLPSDWQQCLADVVPNLSLAEPLYVLQAAQLEPSYVLQAVATGPGRTEVNYILSHLSLVACTLCAVRSGLQ